MHPTLSPAGLSAQPGIRPEIQQHFNTAKEKHFELQGRILQFIREVALPTCKEIGDELLAAKAFYTAGQRGPGGHASRFLSDAMAATGLGKTQIKNYIRISEQWNRLTDAMADMPDDATEITSQRGALQLLTALDRVERGEQDSPWHRTEPAPTLKAEKPNFFRASSARKQAMPVLASIRKMSTISADQRQRLAQIESALDQLLAELEQQESTPAVELMPVEVEEEPAGAPAVIPSQSDEQEDEPEATSPEVDLRALYPATEAGEEQLRADIAQHGSGKKLAIHLGLGHLKRPAQKISDHKGWIKRMIERRSAKV